MADETRNANVVLTADISQYNQQTQQAYTQTNKLTESVNKLSQSLDGITKRAGKKLLLFAAADLAALTGVVAVTARYEKQLTTLRAQVAISNKDLALYKRNIDDISKAIPVSRGEIAQLVTQIQDLGVTSQVEVTKMAAAFAKMSAATGEDVGQLASGLIELSRTMGTLANGAQGIQNFSDSVVALSAELGVSSTAVLAFAQNISPFARAANIGQKEILGLSAAFVKAGADGNGAATAFNQIVSEITQLTQTGSPELMKFSNAAGMTLETFKNLSAVEQFVSIVDAVTKAGPKGTQVLQSMGVESVRTAKALAALSSQSGGLRDALGISDSRYGQGDTEKGAQAAWKSLDAEMQQTKNTMERMTAEIGRFLLPISTALLGVFNQIAAVAEKIATPFLAISGVLAAATGVMAGFAGSLLTAMGPLSTLMLAMTAFRLSPMRSGLAGLREGVAIGRTPVPMGLPDRMTDAGRRFDAGRMPWYQRIPFAASQRVGEAVGRYLPQGAAQAMRFAGYGALRGIQALGEGQQQWIANAAMRNGLDRVSAFGGDPTRLAPATTGAIIRNAAAHPISFTRGLMAGRPDELVGRTTQQLTRSMGETVRAYAAQAGAAYAARNTTASLAAAAGGAARALGLIPLAYGKMAASLAVQGAGRLARAPFEMIGNMAGGGAMTGAVIGGVALGALSLRNTLDSTNKQYDGTRNITAYNAALGLATEPLNAFTSAVKSATAALASPTEALIKGAGDGGSSSGRDYTDKRVAGLPENIDAAVSFMESLGSLNKEQSYLVGQDISKRFYGTGIDPRQIISEYNRRTNNGQDVMGVGGNASSGLIRGYGDVKTEFRGWTQGIRNVIPDEARDILKTIFTTAIEEGDKYRDQTTSTGKNAQELVQASRQRANLEEMIGNENFQALDIKTYLANFETAQGGGLGLNAGDYKNIDSIETLISMVGKSDNKDAKAFVTEMMAALPIAELVKVLNTQITSTSPSSMTALGRWMEGNPLVQRASALGDATQDPVVTFNAYKEIAGYLLDSSKSVSDIAAKSRNWMNTQAPGSRGYALAEAAENYAVGRRLYQTQITQGSMAATGQQYAKNVADIKYSTNADMSGQEAENFQISQDTRAKAAEYYLFVKNFYRQRVYAAQDFARQIKYATEDAAKAMFDPYQRMQNTGVASADWLVANMREQAEAVREQADNLAKMRKAGVSQSTIEQLSLNAPDKANQVAWMVQQIISDPKLVKEFNSIAKSKETSADRLMKNSRDYARMVDGFQLSQERAIDGLKLYGEEVMGTTTSIVGKTASLLESMGVTSTTYLGNLAELAKKILKLGEPRAGSATTADRARLAAIGDSLTFGAANTGAGNPNLSTVQATKTGKNTWTASGPTGVEIPLPKGWEKWGRKEKIAWYNRNEASIVGASAGGSYGNRPHPENVGSTNRDAFNIDGYAVSSSGNYNPFKMADGKMHAKLTWDGTKWNRKTVVLPENWASVNQDAWWMRNVTMKNLGMASGGIASSPTWRMFGEAGPEAVIPLTGRGTDILAEAFSRAISMEQAKSQRTSGYASRVAYRGDATTIYNNNTTFRIDRIEAQNINDLTRQLKDKERHSNWRKGANAKVG